MSKIRMVVIATLGLIGASLAAGTASALPTVNLAPIIAPAVDTGAIIDKAAWVCGPYRCHRVHPRARYWGGRYYRPHYRHWGWRHRHWRRW